MSDDYKDFHATSWRDHTDRIVTVAVILLATAVAIWIPNNAERQVSAENVPLRIIDLGYRPCAKYNALGNRLTAEIAQCPDGKRCVVMCEYEGMRFMTRDEAQL